MSYLVISTSLREGSRSKIMAKTLAESVKDSEFFDLQNNPLPMCDGDKCYDLPEVIDFRKKVKSAKGIIMAITNHFKAPIPRNTFVLLLRSTNFMPI